MALRTSSYQISNATLDQPRDDLWIIQPAGAGWFLPVVGGIILTAMGLFFLLALKNALFLSVFFFVGAVYYITFYPLAAQARFDFTAREVVFIATYLLRFPRHVDWCVPFSEVAGLGLRPRPFGQSRTAQLTLQNGTELVMEFGRRVALGQQLIQRFAAAQTGTRAAEPGPDQSVDLLAGIMPESAAQENAAPSSVALSSAASVSVASPTPVTETRTRLQRETRSWGTWLIVMGVLQMFSANGFSPWGVVLLLVGAASFYFQEAAMLVIYAVTIGWAGVTNLLDNTTLLWRGFAIFQFVLVGVIFWQFRQFRRAEKLAANATGNSILPPTPTRTQRWFPFIALLLGGVALLLFIAAIGSAFLLHNRDLLPIINLFETLAVNMAVLGVATGLAGWLTIPANRWVSIVGCLAGGLTLVAELGIPLIIDALL